MVMQYIIEILQQDFTRITMTGLDNETLLESMIRQGIPYRSDCGGRGSCGKCKVQVIEGDLSITANDLKVFSEKELQIGYRLSCKAYPREDITIKLIGGNETGMEVITESLPVSSVDTLSLTEQGYIIAIDLGTTTVAISLVDRNDNSIIETHTAMNPQRAYGADVISRIKASNEGKKELLRDAICKSLREGILSVIKEAGIDTSKIKNIAIAGNSTMGHLLMGYSCESLGLYPFTPINIDTIEVKYKDVLAAPRSKEVHNEYEKTEYIRDLNLLQTRNDDLIEQLLLEVPVILLPGISAFVGGDIVAGLAFCGFHTLKKPCLLIDFGTNGEMALGNMEKILVTSTAAGPAFEGVNISCGIGSIPGAISGIRIQGKEVIINTIGNKPPLGICGTGVIEIASELYEAKLIDETGLLVDEYFKEGFPIPCDQRKKDLQETGNTEQYNGVIHQISFTQKDIRELQLAKAAIRAGIEIIAKNYGITPEEIDKVYLAGGFGFKLNVEKAIRIGLLPEAFREKITVIGNSSLAGAASYLTDSDTKGSIERILAVSEEIHLSNDEDFNELYLNYMSF